MYQSGGYQFVMLQANNLDTIGIISYALSLIVPSIFQRLFMATDPSLPDIGYVRIKQVLRLIPVSKSTWWAGVKSGRFPAPVRLGSHITAWRVQDIKTYIADLDAQAETKGSA